MTFQELRPYQTRAVDAAREHIFRGRTSPLIVSPTGSGKTHIIAAIARAHREIGGHVVALAHRQELVEQIRERLRAFGTHAEVATVQALLSASRAHGFQAPRCSLLILDEAHHYVADEWCAARALLSPEIVVGFTATPERGDGRGLGGMFDSLVVAATIRELTAAGHLVPLKIVTPAKRLDPGQLAAHPVDAYQQHCSGERAIVFVGSVPDGAVLEADFIARGIKASVVAGAMPDHARTSVLREFRDGTRPVLINVHLLTEGFDCPETSACILARGFTTQGALIQAAGRVLRPAPGKTRALLLDLPGVVHVFGDPTEDKAYSLNGRGIRRSEGDARFCGVCSELLEEDATECPGCGVSCAAPPKKPTKVVNVPLGDFIGIKTGDQDKRAGRLAALMREGFSRGHKPGWAKMMFRQQVGFWPTKAVETMAKELLKGAA